MCYVDERGRLSAIGTTLEINDFVMESSGRMYVTNKGVERFKVTKVRHHLNEQLGAAAAGACACW